MRFTHAYAILAVTVLSLGSAPAMAETAASVTVDSCWIRQMPATVPSGGFFEAQNHSANDVQLKSVKSDDYGMIMLHESKTVDGVSKMSMVHDVNIPANGGLSFKPGGYHIMLEQPRDGIKLGDKLKLDFEFSNSEVYTAECEIRSPKDLSGVTHSHSSH